MIDFAAILARRRHFNLSNLIFNILTLIYDIGNISTFVFPLMLFLVNSIAIFANWLSFPAVPFGKFFQ